MPGQRVPLAHTDDDSLEEGALRACTYGSSRRSPRGARLTDRPTSARVRREVTIGTVRSRHRGTRAIKIAQLAGSWARAEPHERDGDP